MKVGDGPIPPDVALPLIRNRIERLTHGYRDDPNATAGDFALLGIVRDLVDVVEQLATATGGTS